MCGGGSNSGGGGGGGGNNNSGGSNSGGSKPKPSGGHPSAGTGNSNNGGSSGHPSAGTGNSNSGSQNWKSGGGSNNSGGSNNNSGSSNSNSGNKSGGGGNNNGGSNNKKPETTTPPPPKTPPPSKTETTGSENSGGSSPPPPGHPEHNQNASSPPPGHPEYNETATLPNEEETSGGTESGSSKTGSGGEETSSGNTGGDDGSQHPLNKAGGGDDEGGSSGHPSAGSGGETGGDDDQKTYADEFYDPDPPEETKNDDKSENDSQTTQTSSNDKETKQPDKGIYGIVKFLRDVHEESYVEDNEFTKEAVTMHSLLKGGTLYIAFKGQNILNTKSVSQSKKLLQGKKIDGNDEFVAQIITIIDKALKDSGQESQLKINIGGFSQGGRLAMEFIPDIAKKYGDNDRVILEHVLTVDGLGLNEDQIQNFNKIAEKNNLKVTSITNPNVDNDTTSSELVYKALPLPKSENYVVYVPKGKNNNKTEDKQPKHNGKDMLDLVLRSTDDNHDEKGDFLKYVGENGSYYTHFVADYIETEFDSPPPKKSIIIVKPDAVLFEDVKVDILFVVGDDGDETIKVSEQSKAPSYILYGGGGADELIGGKGADTFLISKADYLASKETTTIRDFTDGTDKLSFHDSISYDDVTVETSGKQSKIKVKGTDDIIALINHDIDTVISEDDFVPAPIL